MAAVVLPAEQLQLQVHWQPRRTYGPPFDLDLFAFCLTEEAKVRHTGDVVFFNQRQHFNKALQLWGDDRDGRGDGERLDIDLTLLPWPIVQVVLGVAIYHGVECTQTFGQLPSARLTLTLQPMDVAIAVYDLVEQASVFHTLVVGSLNRHSDHWHFLGQFQGVNGGMIELCDRFGVTVERP